MAIGVLIAAIALAVFSAIALVFMGQAWSLGDQVQRSLVQQYSAE